jgi:hypothetical protein
MNRYEIALEKNPPPVKQPKKKAPPKEIDAESIEREVTIDRLSRTSEGRSRLAALMANSINSQLNERSFARRCLLMQNLAAGELPVYRHESICIDETRLRAIRVSSRNPIPIFEIASNPEISLASVRQRRFALIDRAQDLATAEIERTEEELALVLFGHYANAMDRNIITSGSVITRDLFREAFSSLENAEVIPRTVLMNALDFASFRRLERSELEPVSDRARLAVGHVYNMWGAEIHIARTVTPGYIYVLAEPSLVGRMPIRTEMTVLSADDPMRQTMGWSIFENIGMACYNPQAIARIVLEGQLSLLGEESEFRNIGSWIIGNKA